MKKTLLAVMIMLVSIYGCTSGDQEVSVPKSAEEVEEPAARSFKLNVDMEEEKRLQATVDNGHQIWRTNPVDVAHAALTNQGLNIKTSDCTLVVEHKAHCMIKAEAKDGTYNVHVERLVRPDGIWTATEIEIKGEGSQQSHEHGGHGQHKSLY